MLHDQSPSSLLETHKASGFCCLSLNRNCVESATLKTQNVLELTVILSFIILIFLPQDIQTLYGRILILNMEIYFCDIQRSATG